MGIWRRVEEAAWTGKIRKDDGVLGESRVGITRRKFSALLAGKGGEDCFFIKVSYVAVLGASVSYVDLNREEAQKLKAALGMRWCRCGS